MGCASSKPSKSKKDTKKLNKKSKSTDGIAEDAGSNAASSSQYGDQLIALDKSLLDQIKKNEARVVEYIAQLVQRDLNAELSKQSPQATSLQQDTDDLIIDVGSKAINLLVNTPLPNTTLSYKSLNQSLNSWKFLCKNQSNRTRIIDLTSETIVDCLHNINEELKTNASLDLLQYLTAHSTLTPPQTPQKQTPQKQTQEELWNQNAVLLNRTKANQIARLLFLSNKARPVIHASSSIKDAYFVNRELPDKTQVSISEQEIEEILNNSTYKNNPHITPVTGRKLDMVNDILPKSFSTPEALGEVVVVEEVAIETTVQQSHANDTSQDQDRTTCLDDPSDYEKVECINLTVETSNTDQVEPTSNNVEDSADTNAVEVEAKEETGHNDDNNNTEFLDSIVNEINNLQTSINNHGEETTESKDTDKLESEGTTVTPPTTPEVQPGDEGCATETTEAEDTLRTVLTAGSETTPTVEAEDTTKDSSEEQTTTNDSQTVEQENGNMDSVLKQELLDDRFYNNDTFKSGVPVNGSDAQNDAATTIQAGFKGEATRQVNNETATLLVHHHGHHHKLVENPAHHPANELFDMKAEHDAAVLIQASYRGYQSRKKNTVRLPVAQELSTLSESENDAE